MKEESPELINKPVWLHAEKRETDRASTATLSKQEILKARAKALAQQTKTIHEDQFEVAEFLLGRESYAFELEHLREVSSLLEVTHIPCSPPFVAGVINLRGQIIPIIDILRFINIASAEDGLSVFNKAIIVQFDKLVVGILADEVVGAKKINVSSLQFGLYGADGQSSEYLKGVTKERLVILDAKKILTDPRLCGKAQEFAGS